MDVSNHPIQKEKWNYYSGIWKSQYYGIEPTFHFTNISNGKLIVGTNMGHVNAILTSDPNLFFTSVVETVVYEDYTLYVENAEGKKWLDPVTETNDLITKDPNHRLLDKWRLETIINCLKDLDRIDEAKEIEKIMEGIL